MAKKNFLIWRTQEINTSIWVDLRDLRGEVLIVSCLASVNPFRVDIDWFGEIINSGTVVFQADSATDSARIPWPIDLYLARLFVITEGTVEESVQWLDGLFRSHRLAFRLFLGHRVGGECRRLGRKSTQTRMSLQSPKTIELNNPWRIKYRHQNKAPKRWTTLSIAKPKNFQLLLFFRNSRTNLDFTWNYFLNEKQVACLTNLVHEVSVFASSRVGIDGNSSCGVWLECDLFSKPIYLSRSSQIVPLKSCFEIDFILNGKHFSRCCSVRFSPPTTNNYIAITVDSICAPFFAILNR